MQTDPTPLDERLQRMVNLKVHDYSDAMESMERKYWEGYYDALVLCYGLTYDISFAEGIIKENEKDGH